MEAVEPHPCDVSLMIDIKRNRNQTVMHCYCNAKYKGNTNKDFFKDKIAGEQRAPDFANVIYYLLKCSPIRIIMHLV